ncbi:MAG TPA: PAS domain-containing protein [Blastocatellia bacterium]|nr:PAS domain-containing protein [Blastocatellia bacterium]
MLKPEEWDRVFNAIPDAITIHNSSGQISWANEQAEKLYGRRSGGLVGLSCQEIFHDGGTFCPHDEVVMNRRPAQAETRMMMSDSSFSVYISPLLNDRGDVTGYVRLMRDVTEKEKARGQSLWAERFTTLGQMINGIAHDVGTPLNIISGYAEYLLMRTMPDGAGYKELTTILNQTRRISEFIKQMLDLARPSQGRIDAIGLKGFIGETIDLMGHHLRKSRVQASLLCKSEPPLVYGDAPRLRQAIFNLLLNASQRVGPEGSIEIELGEDCTEKDFTRISIRGSDRLGEGIDLSQTFHPFLSADEDTEGAGMGLSLAKEILNGFGARFEAVSMPETGVGFAIYLPRGKHATGRVMECDAS